MSKRIKEAIIFVGGILIIFAVYISVGGIRDHVELSKQEAMRESWQEGYDQGYSDAYFLLTGDEE